MKWEALDWNANRIYRKEWQMDEATVKLGFALATLTNWYDEDEPENEE